MSLNERLRLIAGVFVLASVVFGATVHPYWSYVAAFVAVNLIQSAFTGWCPMTALVRTPGVQGLHAVEVRLGGRMRRGDALTTRQSTHTHP